MSDNKQHTYAIYYGDDLVGATKEQKTVAISSFIINLKKYHWGPASFAVVGDAQTPADEPVITGRFLPAELGIATDHDLRFEAIKVSQPAPAPVA